MHALVCANVTIAIAIYTYVANKNLHDCDISEKN